MNKYPLPLQQQGQGLDSISSEHHSSTQQQTIIGPSAMNATSNSPILPVIPENIPQEIKNIPRWLVWKAAVKDNGKISKPPYQAAKPMHPAQKNNPDHYAPFEVALAAYQNNEDVAGIGFVAKPEDGLVFLDLDRCIGPDGEPDQNANEVIYSIFSYTEISPSGKGLRIITRGKLPGTQINNHALGREMYDGQKSAYLTITGHILHGLNPITDQAQNRIDQFYQEWSTSSATYDSTMDLNIDFDYSRYPPVSNASDLEYYGLAEKTIKNIIDGAVEKHASRSELLMSVIYACLHKLVPPAVIVDIATNPAFGISEKPLEERGSVDSAREWVKPQVVKAIQKLAEAGEIILTEQGNLRKKSTNEQMNDEYGVVNHGGKTYVVSRKIDPSNGHLVDEFIQPRELKLLLQHQDAYDERGRAITTEGNHPKPIKRFDCWFAWHGRRTFSGVTFRPAPNTYSKDLLKLPESGEVYNTWKGLHVQPYTGDCSKINSHIKYILCSGNEELFSYVWRWLARMVQRPELPAETAILLRSGQGTGKNTIADIFVEFLGAHGTSVTSSEQLAGRFNGHLSQIVFLFANEALWGGDKKNEGVIKNLITDEYRTVEEKFMPVTRVKNHIHLILATNHDWAAPMDLDDRRFVVLDVANHQRNSHDYFKQLKYEIDNGGKEALLYDLLHTDIADFNPRVLPRSQGKSKLIDQLKTADPIIRWWYSCVESGELSIPFTDVNNGLVSYSSGPDSWSQGSLFLIKKQLHQAYLHYCESQRIYHRHDHPIFMKKLISIFNHGLERTFTDKRIEGQRHVQIADLHTARVLFGRAVGNPDIDWEDE